MKTFLYKLHILSLKLILIIICCTPLYITNAETHKNNFNILVINSYNSSSEWENFVLNGVKRKLDTNKNITMCYEYLDVRTRYDDTYLNSFLELLNLKYSNKPIDAILTIDDEAFNFARNNLFNNQSIFFKKPIVFTGVNEPLTLNEKEENYIKGVIQAEDNITLINMILNIHKDLEEINIIIDNATYSEVVKNNLLNVQNFFSRPIKLNFIQHTFIEDVTNELSLNNNLNQVNIIIGDFKYTNTNLICPLPETITLIENSNHKPIYTKSQPYLFAGVVGGIVDWGEGHGLVVGDILLQLSLRDHIKTIYPIYNSLEQTVFNYDVIRSYGINPFLLPENSIFINKGPLDFLLPNWLLIVLWISIIILIYLLFLLIHKLIKHKHNSIRNELLYLEAEKTEKIKTEFISNVSHELRTPLNIILNTCRLLTIKIHTSDIDKEYFTEKLGYINKNSNRLLRLVNNILDVTRLDSGFIVPYFKSQNIVEVIEDTVLSVVDLAKSHNIEIIFDTCEEEIITAIDELKIERALLNLLSNAIKFTLPGGTIYVSIKLNFKNIVIDIKDTGIGIPESYLPFIFERFKQVDSSFTRFNEGSGLGLSIVKGLITLHNGTINVISSEGVGSTFTIILPITTVNNEHNNYAIENSELTQIVHIELSDIIEK